ncbi:CCA tRNA nucleotidyltransferase [Rhodobacteraceae bacterium M382]|nr:CCA tRNA nucleotidyltransferase [Rhodobacteraceae bacterium M382]
MTRIDQPWLTDTATQTVCAALTVDGAQALFVGGCVRNALLGQPVSDLDIATDAQPETVIALAKRAGIRAVPTGIDHGTVTLIEHGVPFEVTTFRRDVLTDGRRAVVAFSTDIAEDARRRDFTMNAIYARPNGEIVDPLGGLADLNARRVRFIGNGENRIREDYLRSLRYFRFHAWYGDPQAGIDPEALAAISANLDGLAQLSRERVGSEVLKLLGARDPALSVAAMRQSGVLAQILPGSDDRALAILVHLEGEAPTNPVRRLAALGDPEIAKDLRMSKQRFTELRMLREAAVGSQGAAELGYKLGHDHARDAMLLRAALMEQPISPEVETDIALGAGATFPVSARDLMPEMTGPELGRTLKSLERTWIDSGFTLDRDQLLGTLD